MSYIFRAVMGSPSPNAPSPPSARSQWFQRRLIPFLQAISRRACTHPIHTIAFVAILASTTYIGLLETALFEPPTTAASIAGQVDFNSLWTGSRTLYASKETDWKWQNGDYEDAESRKFASQHLALLTLVFPDSVINGTTVPAPQKSAMPALSKSSVKHLPTQKNLLSPISQETTLAFSLPYGAVTDFLTSAQELEVTSDSIILYNDAGIAVEENKDQKWIMSATLSDEGAQRSFKRRVVDAWTAFLDVLKNAEELDIIIMVLGYLSMHLTFVSLFMSLRRMGSNFWLGTTVLFSSAFALLFGLIVTIKCGIPLNMVLLSEGLPFLVVTIGFEKPIVLTKAVLSASVSPRRPSTNARALADGHVAQNAGSSSTVQSAVQIAVKEKGFEIVRDYVIEILILVAGAASGVQGGLCQFCFLAAWILFFDCILLFTFYTSILTIKLEINRIKRNVSLRRALEEDGVSRKVAEQVARNDEWPRQDAAERSNVNLSNGEFSVFGMKARDSSISKFKVLMVAGFIAINVLNFCTVPFRSGIRSTGSALSSAVTQPPMDPFKVAANGLETILEGVRYSRKSTMITVLAPIKYQLESSSGSFGDDNSSIFDIDFADQLRNGMGGKVVEGVLKSFEDPFLSKWIIIALAMSLVLNGYLFNAARWTAKDPAQEISNGGTQRTAQAQIIPQGDLPRPAEQVVRQPRMFREESEEDGLEMPSRSRGIQIVKRTPADCEAILIAKQASSLNDEELIDLSLRNKLAGYALESTLGDKTRAVKIRRAVIARTVATTEYTSVLENSNLPYEHYNYDYVHGACCENVIGYLPLPLGVAGPIVVDGRSYFLPMATTEGVLVASTSRGAKAINAGGGATTVLTGDGMTRGPCVGFETLARAGAAKLWLDSEEGTNVMREAFNSTSRFARLQTLKTALAGTYLYIRFKTTTGDAMGMNMISKGVEHALKVMAEDSGFSDMSIISVSGNFCIDKKPAAINWVDGRGKSVVAEAIIPAHVVEKVLKSSVDALVELNIAKNLVGSAMAGSIGGFNAQAANIVTAIFLATGQDPAQNVESSNCITIMKNYHGSLQISVSMPCIEVGTIGGGTFLPPQADMLKMLGVAGAHPTRPGDNARQLARIIAAGVLAGELSLCSALAAGHLVKAHMQHNRSQNPTRASTPQPLPHTLSMTAVKDIAGSNRSAGR